MYIGTSLGKCLRSILLSEVSEDDILLIVTRTKATDLDKFLGVVKQYYTEAGNYSSRNPSAYDISLRPLDEVLALSERLYTQGKIHQPRLYGFESGTFTHPELQMALWIEVAPANRNTTPAVKQAYEHYKMLDSLTK
jgi:hypothetical protein